MIVSRMELADWFGVSKTALDNWDHQGMPCVSRGRGTTASQYDSVAVLEWRLQQLVGRGEKEKARERRDRLEGDRLEMTIARESGEVVDATEIQQLFGSMVVAARAELLGATAAIKAEADARYGIDLDERIVTDHHEQALSRLAAGQDDGERVPGDSGGGGTVGATTADGNPGVGG